MYIKEAYKKIELNKCDFTLLFKLIYFILKKNKRNYNYGNYSFSRDDGMNKSTSKKEITNTSSIENEIQKKLKPYLKKLYWNI